MKSNKEIREGIVTTSVTFIGYLVLLQKENAYKYGIDKDKLCVI